MTRAVTTGRPFPLGVTVDDDGVNVAVWSANAARVELCLFDETGAEERIDLVFRDGDVRHAHVAGVRPGARYGLRAHGPHRPDEGLRFNPAKLLIDPYARALDRPLRWDEAMAGHAGDDDLTLDDRDSAPVVPHGIVQGDPAGPDPTTNRPGHAFSDLVIYEAHVKGLTAAHPGVPEDVRGTYAGLASPAVIDHLTSLGVNAVELLPVQAFLDDRFLVAKGLRNYWGYQPIAWCAPEPRYARADAVAELRQAVHALHEAGIEVIVDVVYNHTGEGDELGPTLSLRGLDNTAYYRLADDHRHYVDDTGTGNTLAVDRPPVLRLVMDSLRHWVEVLGVDGFRFDLATTLGRTQKGFRPHGPFFSAIRQDPVLSTVKLIAEPWDLGPGGHRLGRFPHPFSEWNDRFRDGIRRAWQVRSLGSADVGARLLGSADHFDHGSRGATASVNFVTAHDGFTAADLASYAHKHNEANGEDNRDGHDENLSDNLGIEGPTDDPDVLTARARRVRGLLATLLVSQGVPMLLAGDELGNSQGGNNNAYAQDNALGWIDWSAPDTELLDLVRRLVRLRRDQPVLRQRTFMHGRERADGHRDVAWHRADGAAPTAEDWHDPEWRSVGLLLRGAAGDPVGEALDDAVFLVLNVGDDVEVVLPEPGQDRAWRLEVDTARPGDDVSFGSTYPALGQSVVVLAAR
ncbi:glycogen debranching protein GlgX [Aeromicrobium choanae]|uniref:Glycogen operon protein n=1 Tax=Aeromicrobium choanae TaxID=1736691 RepID=A0A1T4YZ87_9ACTN|nr:glycogen debranching protein GlgX [Aeromicrobium choanae]SKB06943.1 glycogen operon protein [Aeromicrobium choanae]